MRKPLIILLACVVVTGIVSVAFFSLKHKDQIVPEDKCVVVQTESFRVMDMPKEQFDFSPIVSAILYTHLKENDLKLTLPVSIVSSYQIPTTDTLYCGFGVNGRKFLSKFNTSGFVEKREQEGTLKPGEFVRQKETYLYCFLFEYNLADMLTDMVDMDVLEYLKSMPNSIPAHEMFLGKAGDLIYFQQGTWKTQMLASCN